MNTRGLLLCGLMTGSITAWAADPKGNLESARTHYQQAVAQHGSNSPEARRARQNLRSARKTYHTERRQHQKLK